jgi:hypothetical protein
MNIHISFCAINTIKLYLVIQANEEKEENNSIVGAVHGDYMISTVCTIFYILFKSREDRKT